MRGQFDERALEIEIARLRGLELPELRAVWQKHHGSAAPKTVRRKILILSIAWRIQADALGGLKPATRQHLREVAEAARTGAVVPVRAAARTRAGTRLMRVWQGKTHTVTVLGDGFEWQGSRYRSLSQIARLITGTRWNGPVFFGVKRRSPDVAADGKPKSARRSAAMRDPVRKRTFRCAIYTRKSSEEGLEQDFNSLQAQREACEAYITSQRHEGWKAQPAAYDDGAYSGGTMERPALKQLLADVGAGKIDIVVVYKVDRLTRSLMDFAKIVEIFDRQSVSFVSVTQAFNTTSSMGRLTLNVLLSFAQFEREVTGERIRDKIAASKKKGLWMGGFVPLGYRPDQRTLVIHKKEAEIVRMIFKLYCEIGSVAKVEAELVRQGIRRPKSKAITSGRTYGGRAFTRGEIYKLLSNPVYVGEIGHKGQRFDGQHPAIIDPKTWALARTRLATNTHARHIQLGAKDPSLLAGLLFDDTSTRLTPTHTNRQGKRYRYYAKPSSQPHGRGRPREADRGWRIPAPEIEKATVNLLVKQLTDQQWVLKTCGAGDGTIRAGRAVIAKAKDLAGHLRSESRGPLRELLLILLSRVTLSESELRVEIRRTGLPSLLGHVEPTHDGGIALADRLDLDGETADGNGDKTALTVVLPIKLRRRGLEIKLVLDAPGGEKPGEPDPALVKMIANAHQWWEDLVSGRFPTMRALAQAYDKDERYVARVLQLAFLAPAIVDTILTGRQPVEMTAQELITLQDVPVGWASQVSLLVGSSGS